jgi:pimeloyl-ACP methyl ester carboxylesterase
MSFRQDGADITAQGLLHDLTPRVGSTRAVDVAIYVHGLLIDERNWWLGGDSLPTLLHRWLGWVPLTVRYNTGLHISENGESLAQLLTQLATVWGPRLGRIVLVGHSMGGLVCRSALRALQRNESGALERIDRLILLATPNQGADLERLNHAVEFALKFIEKIPRDSAAWMRSQGGGLARRAAWDTFARFTDAMGVVPGLTAGSFRSIIEARSDGIRDVRFGYMTRPEWESAEHDSHRFLLSHRSPLPPPDHVRVFAAAGALWPGAGISRLRNDGLVSVASALGKGGTFDDLGVVEAGNWAEVPLIAHQFVPSSERVAKRLREWVEGRHHWAKP